MNSLSEMILEELWELFPISLVAPKEQWVEDYAEMEAFLKQIFSDCCIVRIGLSEVAKEYEALKLDLWKKFEHNRDAYTEAKTEFIEKTLQCR